MDWPGIVGKNVRRLRLERGLTQEELAVDSAIDVTYLRGIERGRRNPSLLVLVRIASALGAKAVCTSGAAGGQLVAYRKSFAAEI